MLVSLCNNERLWRRSNALKYSAPGQSMRPAELIAIPCETEPGLDIGAAHQRLCLVSRRTYTLTRWEVDLFYRNHELISLVKWLIDDLGDGRGQRGYTRDRAAAWDLIATPSDQVDYFSSSSSLGFAQTMASRGARFIHRLASERTARSHDNFSKTGE